MQVAQKAAALGGAMASGAALPWLVVGALTLAGAVLRLIVADQPLFADELSTYWIVTEHSFGGVMSTVHSDAEITPPLYFVLSWLTSQVSQGPEYIRAPSLVAGAATIPLVYALGIRTVGRAAAMTAAALTALSPFMIYYSAEARAYGLMMTLVVLSTLAMLVAVDSGRNRWWVVYGLSSAAAVYSHYTSIFALGAQLLWLLWVHPGARGAAILANVGAVGLFLPWFTGLRNDLNSPTAEILSSLSPFTLKDIRVALEHWGVGYPYTSVGLRQVPGSAALVLLALALLIAAAGLLQRVVTERAGIRLETPIVGRPRLVLILILVVSVPIGEVLVSAASTDLFVVRNLAASWPALALAVGALLVCCGPRLHYVAVALAVTGVAVGAVKMLDGNNQRPDYQAAADFVRREASPEDVVIDSTGVLSPGPLTALDTTVQPELPVFRAGAPAERDHPFGFRDRLVPFSEAFAQAAAAAQGARIFVVTTDFSRIAATKAQNERQKALQSAARRGRYRPVEVRNFAGFIPAQVEVFERR